MNKIKTYFKKNLMLYKFTLPIFIGLFLQMLVANVDKIMVQNDVSANAINNANTILEILTIFIFVVTVSAVILISQFMGAKDNENLVKIYNLSFFAICLIGIILSIVLCTIPHLLLSLLNVTDELFYEGVIYLRISGGFIFLQAIILILNSFLKANGNAFETLIVSLLFNIINIILNYIFLNIIGIKGAAGVAIASVISRFIGVILLFIVYFKKVKIKFNLKYLKPFPKNILKKMLKIGLPSSGESFSYCISQLVILSFINAMPSANLTTKTFASMLAMISYLFTNSISEAMVIILGRELGSRQYDKANRTVWDVTITSLISSILVSLVLAIFGSNIFSLLTHDQEAIRFGVYVMWIEVFLEIGRAINIVLVRALQTAGDVKYPTIVAVVFCWLVATLGSYILGISLSFGVIGVWIAMSLDELIRAVLFIIRWLKGYWKKYDLIVN